MILVTGGTGLLGSHLLLELVREPQEIVALKRPSSDLEEVRRVFSYYSAKPDALFGRIKWVDADLLNLAGMQEVLSGAEQVYHCAAMVSFEPSQRKNMIRFNTESTATVVNACLNAGIRRLLHVSSSSAIGHPPAGVPADETMIWSKTRNISGYSVSKFRSEMEVWRGIEEGLGAVIVNPTIILGPGFWDRGSSSIFTRVDRGLRFSTTGVTGYVGVHDVVSAMVRLMQSDISGERYILNAGNYSFKEIMERVADALGKPRTMAPVSRSLLMFSAGLDNLAGLITGTRRITRDQARHAHREVHFSSEKVQKELGMSFEPVPDVIRRVAAFYRDDQK